MTTEEELSEVYGVHDPEGRRLLMKAIEVAREEEEASDTDSLVSFIVCYFPAICNTCNSLPVELEHKKENG